MKDERSDEESIWDYRESKFCGMIHREFRNNGLKIAHSFQVNKDVYFIIGEDAVMKEIRVVVDGLSKLGFEVAVFWGGIKEFQRFVSDKKEKLGNMFCFATEQMLQEWDETWYEVENNRKVGC